MKIEQLLVQYLYNTKKVSLQDIGIFIISPDIFLPAENEKETALPPGSINFVYDPKTALDEGLVDFIVQQTRKIRPLASSDLESYSILNKQFLNIGKPLIIEGMGVLQKSQQGMYEFTQGTTANARLDAAPVVVKEKQSEEISFRSVERDTPGRGKKSLLFFVGLLFLAIVAAALYYFLFRKNKPDSVVQTQISTPDTMVRVPPVAMPAIDTANKQFGDTTAVAAMAPAPDGSTFRVVIKEYDTKDAANKAYKKLTGYGHTLIISSVDSIHYKLLMPFTTTLSDTARVRDSLSKFFQSKAYIEYK